MIILRIVLLFLIIPIALCFYFLKGFGELLMELSEFFFDEIDSFTRELGVVRLARKLEAENKKLKHESESEDGND